VAGKNHRNFVMFLTYTFISLCFCARHSWICLQDSANPLPIFPLYSFISGSFEQRPFALTLFVLHIIHICWLGMLLLAQILPIIHGITAHEKERGAKYRYMQDRYGRWNNPFDAGIVENVREFLHPTNNWDKPDIQQFVQYNLAPIEPLPPELVTENEQQASAYPKAGEKIPYSAV